MNIYLYGIFFAIITNTQTYILYKIKESPQKMISTMTKPPLLELVVEIQFLSSEPDNFIVGLLERLAKKHGYTTINNLGLVHIPEELRKQDPNLIHAPWYRITKPDAPHLSCFIGPKIFSLSWAKPPHLINQEPFFPGWSHSVKNIFMSIISDIIEQTKEFRMSFENVRYRTIDIFQEGKIIENTNFSLMLGDDDLSNKKMDTNLTFKKSNGLLSHMISISNSSQFNQAIPGMPSVGVNGSSLDITTNYFLKKGDIEEDLMSIIQTCHDENKKVFSSIIKKDFAIKELGAKYDN